MNNLIRKDLIKKKFLKALRIKLSQGKGPILPHQAILKMLHEILDVEPLSDEEYQYGLEAVEELERDGYLEKLAGSNIRYNLTAKGVKISSKSIEEMKLPKADVAKLIISRGDLFLRSYEDYMRGDYETSIFKAYKLLEEKVREKSNLQPSDFGTPLIDKAFMPNVGILRHPGAKTPGEQDGIRYLIRGAYSVFKNPRSHRTVDLEDPNTTIEALVLAKLLLDIVDQCEISQKHENT